MSSKVLEYRQPAPALADDETHDGEQPQPVTKYSKPDDDEIALKLAETLTDKLAYFHSGWRLYERGVWTAREVYELRRYIRKELRSWRAAGVSVSQTRIKALASMLEDDLYIPDRRIIDAQHDQRKYVPLRNGLFNLETMQLEPHRPDLYFTTQLDFDFDPAAQCPTMHRYLNSSLVQKGSAKPDNALITMVWEALAYSMTARTDLKSSFWLVGEKDSGKSTFISVLRGIMGSLHTTIDLTQLGVNRFLLAGIVGKRVVTFTEASGNAVLPDALYKALVGGSDEIYADVKNRDPIVFRPETKVWWAMNEMPRVVDRSGATTRRIIIIPFNRSIPEKDRIGDLEQRLMRERSGIFNWMIVHYKRLQAAGAIELCEQSEQLRQEYIQENDTEATFVDEMCECHESYRVQSSVLYRAYAEWCNERGFRPRNYNQIAQEWRRLGFESKKSDVVVWTGVRLRELRRVG